MDSKFDAFDSTEQQIVDTVKHHLPGVMGIYLFGSVAHGENHAQSDVDIALLPAQPLSSSVIFELHKTLSLTLMRDIDLIDLLKANTVFQFEIITTGKRLYALDKVTCDAFEGLVLSSYLRLEEERAEIIQDVNARGKIYGR